MALSPASDTFVSTSLDNTLRLWDIRSQSPQGQLNLTSPSLAAYDPTATVLAIACLPAQSIMLYDVRNYDKAPFATFEMRDIESTFSTKRYSSNAQAAASTSSSPTPPGSWTKLEFSNDGKRLLIATTGPGHYLLDAFEGNLDAYLPRPLGPTGRIPPGDLGALRAAQHAGNTGRGVPGQGDACFSPDGRYVIGGSGEAGVYAWDAEGEGRDGPERVLSPTMELGKGGAGGGAACVVGYNPRYNLLATADRALVFWMPEME